MMSDKPLDHHILCVKEGGRNPAVCELCRYLNEVDSSNTTSKDDELIERISEIIDPSDRLIRTGTITGRQIDKIHAAIKQYGIQERIDELGGVQLDYGNRVAQTFINGEAMTVTERYEQLTALKAKGEE